MVRSQTRKPEIEVLIPEDPEPHPALLYGLIGKLFAKEPEPAPAPPPLKEEPIPVVTPEWMPTEQHHHYHTVYRTPRWIEVTILAASIVNLCLLTAHLWGL